MRKLILAISALALGHYRGLADPIADRKALMKERGRHRRRACRSGQGREPFDAAEVLAALKTLNANAEKIDVDALFPAGTDQGDTTASPKIWEDMAGFKAAGDKFKADTAAAVAAAPPGCRGAEGAARQPSVRIAAAATRPIAPSRRLTG